MALKTALWIFIGIILYAYLGYTLLLALVAFFQRRDVSFQKRVQSFEPPVTLFIPAYNEAGSIEAKMRNSLALDYPREKLTIVWITDGSDDDSLTILNRFGDITVFHEMERSGKIHAMNRGMKLITTPFVVFTDANTLLNKDAIRVIVQYFEDDNVGCVAGEKRIENNNLEKAVEAGEGLYWQYESLIKRLESKNGSAIGAVGELFAVRTSLYEEVKEDTILDDFVISLKIAVRGYKIKYAPGAWSSETASFSVREELKRKIRIACGGWQTLFRMPYLLNIVKYGFLSWKYFSHKVLRWTVVPLAFIMAFILNLILVWGKPLFSDLYGYLFCLQLLFYLAILFGALFHNIRTRVKLLFAPYYMFVMNYAIVAGMLRYFSGNYSVKWEKSKRS
ncbi:MAG: glycosyltransferase family 2 protein [Bacteroidales bacterium]|nr:glycosyltransferase family 2 protein [Bacteroidales bacterium]